MCITLMRLSQRGTIQRRVKIVKRSWSTHTHGHCKMCGRHVHQTSPDNGFPLEWIIASKIRLFRQPNIRLMEFIHFIQTIINFTFPPSICLRPQISHSQDRTSIRADFCNKTTSTYYFYSSDRMNKCVENARPSSYSSKFGVNFLGFYIQKTTLFPT